MPKKQQKRPIKREILGENSEKNTQSGDFLGSILDAITDGITVIKKDYSIKYINQSLVHFYGFERAEDVIGKKCYSLYRRQKKECAHCPAQKIFKNAKPHHTTFSSKDFHGNDIYWEIYFYPLFDQYGEVESVVEYSRNITKEKMLEIRVEKTERKLADILSISRDVVAEYDYLLKPKYISENVEVLTGRSADEHMKSGGFLSFLPPEKVREIRSNLKVPKPKSTTAQLYESHITRSDGKEVPVEIQIAQARENKKLTGIVATIRDITERKQIEMSMRENERRYRLLFENSPASITVLDIKGRILDCNEYTFKLTGFSKKEMVGKPFEKVLAIKPQDLKLLKKRFSELAKGLVLKPQELEIVRKDKTKRWVHIASTPIKLDNRIIGVQVISSDTTEQKKAQQQMVSANERLQYLLSATSAVIYSSKPSGDYGAIFISDNVKQLVGYSKKNFLKKSSFWSDHIHPEDLKIVFSGLKKLEKKDKLSYEYRFRHKKGHYIWVRDEMKVIRDEKGKALEIIGFWLDITERKKAEYALKESEELYRTLVQTSPDGIVLTDLDTNIVMVNKSGCQDIGYKNPDELIGKSAFDLMAPEDQARILENIDEIVKTGKVNNARFNFLHKNGSRVPIEFNASLVYDEKGEPKAFLGIARNISERKEAERALKESEELYRSLIETSPDAITLTDLEGRITFVSKRAVELSGYKKAKDLIGKNAFDFIHPDYREIAVKNLQKTLKKGFVRNAVYTMLKKDKTPYSGELNAALIRDVEGKPKAFIATTRDITARKQAEEALRYRLEFEEIITTFSTHLINLRTDEIDEGIEIALENIGNFTKVDRCFVFLLHDDKKRMSNTHEWCAKGIESRKKDLQNIDVVDMEWGMERLKKLFPLNIPRTNALPKEAQADKKMLKSLGIKSFLSVPMVIGRDIVGFTGFETVKEFRTWSEDTISILQIVAEIFGNALERKRAEETIFESEEKFKSLAEESPNMIFINKKGRIVYTNEICEQILGYKREEFLSPSFDFLSLIDTDSVKIIKRNFAMHMKGEEVAPYEYALLTKDHRKIDVIINTKLINYEGERAILGIITDISERKRTEDKLKEVKEFSESIVSSMAEGIMILDREGFIIFINPKIEEILGYNETQLIGKHWEMLLTLDYQKRMRDCIAENLNGEQDRFEAVLIKKNKTELPVLISASPQKRNNKFSDILVVITDISDRIRQDLEREELMKYRIRRGSSYLIEEKNMESASDVVYELYKNHFKGIIITREHPEKIKGELNLNLPVYWMTNDPKDKMSLRPEFAILEKIIDDNIDRSTFVFLDRFDYIVTQNGFREALNFIQHLNEIFYMRKAILLISLDPDTLSMQELSLLEKETSVIERKREEKLSGDLMDLLDFIGKANKVGETPSYNDVSDEFKITRTTARKRIRELIDREFLSEKKSGRFKYLVLTDKGKEML